MKRLTAIIMILVGGVVLTTVAYADDKADVKAAQAALAAAWNAGDADAVAQYRLPESSGFFAGGGLLDKFDKNKIKAAFDSGLKLNIQYRHIDVKVYDNAAVVTGYETGMVTFADGTTIKGPRRLSSVWIKQKGRWKQAHVHISMIIAQQ